LHEWLFAAAGSDDGPASEAEAHGLDVEVFNELFEGVGAYIMGRKMFGGGDGEWDETWEGWWGEDPPYHVPVFVLTHHAREPLPMQGGTTFTFVTDGIESALEQARTAAGEKTVSIAGGADVVQGEFDWVPRLARVR
jgi:dihydrofolate reductase